VSKRNLFVSFAESDGGHSYLATRAMLDPSGIAHLIFRNTVAEALEAVATGQANYAVVPAYNSITQWEGSTLKALASGMFEICAQVCMPTSYVLVAHKDYMTEFVSAFGSITNASAAPTHEDAAKIYTRFLSRIFVGAQADEQYRGRLLRPDMTHATIELSRNPLRVLEEMTRSELMKAMAAAPSRATYGPLPQHLSGGSINIGGTAVLQQTAPTIAQTAPIMDTLQAPAALVAAGLLDAPGDPEGWDQPGSLGEIVSLLRKLLVLLNVYSFGAPDLPENKTQYLLVGRRGAGTPAAGALRLPAATPPTRIMTLVRPSLRKSSADQWLKPRTALARTLRDFGFVLDRAPIMVSTGTTRSFLFEGGRPRDGLSPNPINIFNGTFKWLAEMFEPAAEPGKQKSKEGTLRKTIEKKPERELKDDTPGKFDTMYLGQYPSWCQGLNADSCWCCEEPHADTQSQAGNAVSPVLQLLGGTLIAAVLFAFAYSGYCSFTGSCSLFSAPENYQPAIIQSPPAEPPAPPAIAPVLKVVPPAKPEIAPTAPDNQSTQAPYPGLPYPGLNDKPVPPVAYPGLQEKPQAPRSVEKQPLPPVPKFVPVKPVILHVAFYEAKSNLTRESFNVLATAAGQAVQMNKTVNIRLFALGRREPDSNLWSRRLNAVKDELVRLGVPFERIRVDGNGPYIVIIRAIEPPRARSARQRLTYDLDSIDDPLSNN